MLPENVITEKVINQLHKLPKFLRLIMNSGTTQHTFTSGLTQLS